MSRVDVAAAAAARVPMLADYVAGPFDIPAARMLELDWMAARVRDAARRWKCDGHVAGTLWWYSASSTLVIVPIATALVTGTATAVRLDGAHCGLREDGYLRGLASPPTITGITALASALTETLGAVTDALSGASGIRTGPLWAITTDSIANRSLDVGASLGRRELGSAYATDLVDAMRAAGAPMPRPRFVDVAGTRFTRRCSCCLLYETGGSDKCVSCPRRSPDDRMQGLTRAAGY